MLNEDKTRELAYVVIIDDIQPIEGKDRVEAAVIGGWKVMVKKGQFKPGNLGIYFEIDSKVPEKEPFTFLEKYHYKIKTQKFKNFYSQGLLMHPSDFGWEAVMTTDDGISLKNEVKDDKGNFHSPSDESRFLTKQLGVTYAAADDNKRKAPSADKYKKMAQRRPKLFKKKWARWMMKREWGKKVMFFFFGKKKDKRSGWPSHIAAKTDVERIQNCTWLLNDKQPYIASEKIDGCSCSIMAEKTKFNKIKYYVCSRNVVFEDENQKCFYDENIYFEMYNKYNIKEKITKILNDYNLKNVAIQMEIFGPSVQKRDYSLSKREIRVFHIVSNGVKFPMDKVVEICNKYNLPHVPIIDDNFILPDTIEELQAYVENEGSKIDGKEKEGIVFYDKKTGQTYFKFVSPSFLMKYH